MNFALAEGFFYGTSRLIEVQAIVKLTLIDALSHLWKIMRQLLPGYIHHSEFAHSRGVYNLSAERKIMHFSKGCRMNPPPTPTADVLGFDHHIRDQGINE